MDPWLQNIGGNIDPWNSIGGNVDPGGIVGTHRIISFQVSDIRQRVRHSHRIRHDWHSSYRISLLDHVCYAGKILCHCPTLGLVSHQAVSDSNFHCFRGDLQHSTILWIRAVQLYLYQRVSGQGHKIAKKSSVRVHLQYLDENGKHYFVQYTCIVELETLSQLLRKAFRDEVRLHS